MRVSFPTLIAIVLMSIANSTSASAQGLFSRFSQHGWHRAASNCCNEIAESVVYCPTSCAHSEVCDTTQSIPTVAYQTVTQYRMETRSETVIGQDGKPMQITRTVEVPFTVQVPVQSAVASGERRATTDEVLAQALLELAEIRKKLGRIQTEERVGDPPSLETLELQIEKIRKERSETGKDGAFDTGNSTKSQTRQMDAMWRVWRDVSGKFETIAKLDSTLGKNIRLIKKSGSFCDVHSDQLSETDREFLRVSLHTTSLH